MNILSPFAGNSFIRKKKNTTKASTHAALRQDSGLVNGM
jgi:hypothetical protein